MCDTAHVYCDGNKISKRYYCLRSEVGILQWMKHPRETGPDPLLPTSDERGGLFREENAYRQGGGGMGNLQGHTAQLSKTPELLRLRLGPTSLLNTFSTAHPYKRSGANLYPGYQISKKPSLFFVLNVI